MNGPYRRFPLRPLLLASGAPNVSVLASRLGANRDMLYRDNRFGIPEPRADRYSCAIGYNPSEVWPEWAEWIKDLAA